MKLTTGSPTSTEIFQAQVAADRKHHQDRVEWLTGPRPAYADGVPVRKFDVRNMLSESRACLADTTGMLGHNSAIA
jgi:chorismate synthase